MKLTDLISIGDNVAFTVGAKDLQEFADTLIQRTKNEVNFAINQAKEERYLTEKQVQDMLNVSHSTLWQWNNRKYLCTVKIGNKNRYKYSDVIKLLSGKGTDL